ncbi:MAG: DUF952 domain-containing protein [Nocardioides sp.]|jgi:uncharacterized protein (DUF952 family)
MHIFHIAKQSDWQQARASKSYEISTLGRTLAEEGFIHASRREQVEPTFKRFYRTVHEPLVLLTIDPARLKSELREDQVDDDTYPHIYGPLNTDAVIRVSPLNRKGGTESFTSLFVKEMFVRVAVAMVAMLAGFAGGALGRRTDWEWGPFVGAVLGVLLVALVTYAWTKRPRSA